MNIAVLGYGHIGGTLGKKWITAGHTVIFGVRTPSKPNVRQLVESLGENASAAVIPQAIDAGEVVVFAIPGVAMKETISENARALGAKIVVDATNNFGAPVMNSYAIFAEKTPQVRYFRGFNSYGWENFDQPVFGSVPADLFYCGPGGEAKPVVEQLISEVGLRPIYLGGPDQAGVVDGVLRIWSRLVTDQKMPRQLAFKVLTNQGSM